MKNKPTNNLLTYIFKYNKNKFYVNIKNMIKFTHFSLLQKKKKISYDSISLKKELKNEIKKLN